jgi:hypothetical protein
VKIPYTPPTPLLFYGTSAGGQAFDGDVQGGNPLATALIELTSDPGTRLGNLGALLRQRVARATQRRQLPQVPAQAWPDDWRFVQPLGAASESRLALVLVVSRYADPGVPPLYGAAHDERRVASTLAMHGSSVTQTVEPTRAGILKALASLSRRRAGRSGTMRCCCMRRRMGSTPPRRPICYRPTTLPTAAMCAFQRSWTPFQSDRGRRIGIAKDTPGRRTSNGFECSSIVHDQPETFSLEFGIGTGFGLI